jgi:hypothetical protein
MGFICSWDKRTPPYRVFEILSMYSPFSSEIPVKRKQIIQKLHDIKRY